MERTRDSGKKCGESRPRPPARNAPEPRESVDAAASNDFVAAACAVDAPVAPPDDPYAPEITLKDDADPQHIAQSYEELYRAYRSLLNVVSVYRRQLDVVREQTIHGAQVADFARKLNVAEVDRIGDVIMSDLPRMTGARAGALYLYDPETQYLALLRAAPEPVSPPSPIHLEQDRDRLLGHLLRNHRAPLIVENRADYERRAGRAFSPTPGEEILEDGALLCPLQIDAMGQDPIPVGVLVLSGKCEGFHHHDLERATMLGEMIAAALNTAMLLKRMSVLAETDGLTGLYNHRHFQQELDRAIALVRRYSEPLSLALLDIDWFKNINDVHGHQFGDLVLREMARTVKASVRDKVDIVARYGGEEFAVIMPNTDRRGALHTAERIRANVQKMALRNNNRAIRITVSCGVATYESPQEKSAFIDLADRALYDAKNNGRNRVECLQK